MVGMSSLGCLVKYQSLEEHQNALYKPLQKEYNLSYNNLIVRDHREVAFTYGECHSS